MRFAIVVDAPLFLVYILLFSFLCFLFFFFFNDTATTEIYTLSLHDALPICLDGLHVGDRKLLVPGELRADQLSDPAGAEPDRKSTRLNSSHSQISYAVFCLKKKKNNHDNQCIKHMSTVPQDVRKPNILKQHQ